MAIFEKGPGFAEGLRSFWGDQNFANVGNGIIDGLVFGIIAIPLIQKACSVANLPAEVVESWLVTVYVGGGIISCIMALYYKLPIVGAWSIPGAMALAQILGNFTLPEIVGGFLVAGIFDLILGLTGTVRLLVRKIPGAIMMAMVAGTLFGWGSKCVTSFKTAPVICACGVIGFVICKKFLKKIPAVMGTLIAVFIASLAMGKLAAVPLDFSVAKPMFVMPAFNLKAALSIGIPLGLLVVCAENMQAIGVQVAIGKKPPVTAITVISGIGGIVAPFFCGHNCNIAGPMTAWAGSDDCGDVDKRYVAAVWCGIAFAFTGIFAKFTMGLLAMIPPEALNMVVSLTLIGMIIGALGDSFGSGKFKYGSFVSFITAASGVTFFGIGSAFWALFAGTIITLLLEKNDYDTMVSPLG